MSKHLRHLREAGMVARRKEGLQVYDKLDGPLIEKLRKVACESLLAEFDPAAEEEGE